MSRIGKAPIPVPKGVEISMTERHVTVKGPQGTLERDLPGEITVREDTPEGSDGPVLLVERPDDQRHNRALHQDVLALTMTVVSTPRVNPEKRLTVKHEVDHFWRAEAKRGFMEHPDVPEILTECKTKGVELDLDDVTYYLGAETIVPAKDGKGLPRWQEALFAAMGRNAARMSDYLELPYDQVVEIGREIEI